MVVAPTLDRLATQVLTTAWSGTWSSPVSPTCGGVWTGFLVASDRQLARRQDGRARTWLSIRVELVEGGERTCGHAATGPGVWTSPRGNRQWTVPRSQQGQVPIQAGTPMFRGRSRPSPSLKAASPLTG